MSHAPLSCQEASPCQDGAPVTDITEVPPNLPVTPWGPRLSPSRSGEHHAGHFKRQRDQLL